MIKYTLICDTAHSFEGWFRNSEDFDAQCARLLVACPVCGSKTVQKGLMAPAVSTSRKRAQHEVNAQVSSQASDEAAEEVPAPAKAGGMQPTALLPNDVRQKEIIEALRFVRAKMIENSENVGNDFAAEARKIHYGDAEVRNIYGQTTPQDALDLVEEGIAVLPLPDLPDDKN